MNWISFSAERTALETNPNAERTAVKTNSNAERTAVKTNPNVERTTLLNTNILTNLMKGFCLPKIKMLILTACIFFIGTNIHSAPYSGGGNGSQGTPYIILTMQDWNDFIDDIYIAGLFQGGNDYFQLGADIGSAAPNDRVPNKR